MPVSASSRHRGSVPHVARDAAGIDHPTIGIRVAPPAESAGMLHRVQAGDTLETLAFEYLGASDAWWRIADVNPPAFVFGLPMGATVLIPGTTTGTVVRTRSF